MSKVYDGLLFNQPCVCVCGGGGVWVSGWEAKIFQTFQGVGYEQLMVTQT